MIKAVIFDMFETLITHYDSPLYFGTQIASDAGIDNEVFHRTWKSAEKERMTGEITLEEMLGRILKENGVFSVELLKKLTRKRVGAKEEVFRHLNEEIIPVLEALKNEKVLIGLVSNCYSEEVGVIRHSVLFPFFNAVCLSWEEKCLKPDPVIFERCLERLGVRAQECIYIGDGGSDELEAARKLGMETYQAAWYLDSHGGAPTGYKKEFRQLHSPTEILRIIQHFN